MEEKPLLQRMENEIIEDKSAEIVSEEEIVRIRKEKIGNFFKTNYNWVAYAVLAIITYLAVKIRTSNLLGLKDITTGTWTLGPDLDPFLFLRYAKNIVEDGSLMKHDSMRYVPLGWDTAKETRLLPYMIAYFHKTLSLSSPVSVEYSAVMFPVFMFLLTVIAFFLEIWKVKGGFDILLSRRSIYCFDGFDMGRLDLHFYCHSFIHLYCLYLWKS